MRKGRVFEYCLAALIFLVLLGIFGKQVLALNKQLARSKLTTAYHAMQTSMILMNTRCSVDTDLQCASGEARTVMFVPGGPIVMERGFPSASEGGIVASSGLEPEMYRIQYGDGELMVYIVEQPRNTACRIVYSVPVGVAKEVRLKIDTTGC